MTDPTSADTQEMMAVSMPALADPVGDALAGDAIVDAALSAVGLEWPDPLYALWCMPRGLYPDGSRQADAKSLYTCLQNCLACMRVGGVRAPELALRLDGNGGLLVSWIEAIAKRANAWLPLDDSLSLMPADIVIIGGSAALGGGIHGFVVTDVSDPVITSCDGGQVEGPENRHCILARKRVLARQGAAWWARDADGKHSPQQLGVGRGVYGVCRGRWLPTS